MNSPANDDLFAWLLVCTVVTRGFMTHYLVPWSAIAAELSDDYHERTSVMTHRFAIGWAVAVLTPMYVFTFIMADRVEGGTTLAGQLDPLAYPKMAGLCAALMLAGGLLTTVLTWREIPYLRQPATRQRFSVAQVIADLRRPLENEQCRLTFIVVLMSQAIIGTTTNIASYMQTFFWGFTASDLRWLPLSAVGAIVGVPVVMAVQRRFPRGSRPRRCRRRPSSGWAWSSAWRCRCCTSSR